MYMQKDTTSFFLKSKENEMNVINFYKREVLSC